MFSKNSTTKASQGATAKAAPSLISANLVVDGNIKTDGEVQLDGTVNGDVACGKLTLGEKACVAGEITAEDVIVKGEVKGRIRAGTVLLAKTARVEGDIWHKVLSMESGAQLQGHCNNTDNPKGEQSVQGARIEKLEEAAAGISSGKSETSVAQRQPAEPVVVKKAASN
jgi:cytoskeletal protein CcmA (bactofilin family)